MTYRNTILLLDPCIRRRATISRQLLALGMHVEPLEDPSEIARDWHNADVLLMDTKGLSIDDVAAAMGSEGFWLPIVGFCEDPTPRDIMAAAHQGVVDFISIPCEADDLAQALEEARVNGPRLAASMRRTVLAKNMIKKLSMRETQVLSGMANGLSNRLIGAELDLSPRTVEAHRARMLAKIGVQNTPDAIRLAIDAALVA